MARVLEPFCRLSPIRAILVWTPVGRYRAVGRFWRHGAVRYDATCVWRPSVTSIWQRACPCLCISWTTEPAACARHYSALYIIRINHHVRMRMCTIVGGKVAMVIRHRHSNGYAAMRRVGQGAEEIESHPYLGSLRSAPMQSRRLCSARFITLRIRQRHSAPLSSSVLI